MRLSLKNFRCFKQASFDFIGPVNIIQGDNGSGKTSILEAIHYACHLRSFRTHLTGELVHAPTNGQVSELEGFSLHVSLEMDDIHLGIAGKKRSLKINGTPINHYSKLIDCYRTVTFMEDDLTFVTGYPETRRAFIDQALTVQEPEYFNLIRTARKCVEQRNHLFQANFLHDDSYSLWTDKLVQTTASIVAIRKNYLTLLNNALHDVMLLYGAEPFLRLEYRQKRVLSRPEDFSLLRADELRSGRTLYGSHLDDFDFIMSDRNSRSFASRGQQKLALMLLKIAQTQLLLNLSDKNHDAHEKIFFLVDDFLTDFDDSRIKKLTSLLFSLKVNLIFTIPSQQDFLYNMCREYSSVNLIRLAPQLEISR